MLPIEGVTRRVGACDSNGATAAAQPKRLVLDTNTLLDWWVFGDAAARAVGAAIAERQAHWLTTPRMLAELRAVLMRPLAARWEPARELALTFKLAGLAVLCTEPAAVRRLVCRDASDQVFIDLACEQGPAVLLTRDRALLALRRRALAFGVVIATAAVWCRSEHEKGGP